MRSVELTFDETLDALIRHDWARLAEAGLPSLASHTAPSNRPHITLAAGNSLSLDPGAQDLWGGLPIETRFSGVVVFPSPPGKFVLARLVVLSKALLELHAGLHRRCAGAYANTVPDAWTPHVTLARRIPGHLLGAAVESVDARAEGQCIDARLWDSTTRTVTRLGGPPLQA
ncbi:MAG: 2-5 ligase family protein [Pseudarthrobacter sp.]|nr:2-5 ligase family protein [Pseudarthrobacter sp.]